MYIIERENCYEKKKYNNREQDKMLLVKVIIVRAVF